MRLLGLLVRTFLGAIIVAIPIFGTWTASSLAAWWNGPPWTILLAGALLFPGGPLAWDLFAGWRARRRERARRSRSTFLDDLDARRRGVGLGLFDRLLLRTLALNTVFLTALCLRWPEDVSTALSARGDWMLDGATAPWSDALRRQLLATGDRMEWLYEAAHQNPYAELVTRPSPQPAAIPAPEPRAAPAPDPTPSNERSAEVVPTAPATPAVLPDPAPEWPLPATIDAAIEVLSPEDRVSIETVARALAARAPDRLRLVKALHDYVAVHVAYDFSALDAGHYPDQSAEAVFRTGRAVCAGYSNLLHALGSAAGVEIVTVLGDSRDEHGGVAGGGHAWNAAKLGGRWWLVDVTWNAGHRGKDGAYQAAYRTDYLFTPPEIFRLTHLPEEDRWQLSDPPVNRGDFVRQPMLRPAFFAEGLVIEEPTRSQVTVADVARIRLQNRRSRYLLADWKNVTSGRSGECDVAEDQRGVACTLPEDGTYLVQLYANSERYGRFAGVGSLEFNRR